MNALDWVGVGAVGGVAAVARLLVDAGVAARVGRVFPLGTLAINLSGSLILGVLDGTTLGGDALVISGTALVGAYTTFSTWMYETQRLLEDGDRVRALANLAVSLALGFGAILLGRAIGGAL